MKCLLKKYLYKKYAYHWKNVNKLMTIEEHFSLRYIKLEH